MYLSDVLVKVLAATGYRTWDIAFDTLPIQRSIHQVAETKAFIVQLYSVGFVEKEADVMELRREDLATAAEDRLRWINLLNVPAEG